MWLGRSLSGASKFFFQRTTDLRWSRHCIAKGQGRVENEVPSLSGSKSDCKLNHYMDWGSFSDYVLTIKTNIPEVRLTFYSTWVIFPDSSSTWLNSSDLELTHGNLESENWLELSKVELTHDLIGLQWCSNEAFIVLHSKIAKLWELSYSGISHSQHVILGHLEVPSSNSIN